MIMITGRYSINPDQRSAFLVFARTLVEQELKTEGCIAFGIYEDVTTPNSFLMLEQWESGEALDAHGETDAFKRDEALLDSFIVGEPSWDEYEF